MPAQITDGNGLNPLLQNYWMVIHPVMKLGWVGMTVPFAFAVAALVTGQLGNDWVHTIRRWTLVPWMFLTAGVLMGSQWAYVGLGWGGYWAWDAVENASFLPWLTATTFLHSIMIQERRRAQGLEDGADRHDLRPDGLWHFLDPKTASSKRYTPSRCPISGRCS